jgi:hypothetical protein
MAAAFLAIEQNGLFSTQATFGPFPRFPSGELTTFSWCEAKKYLYCRMPLEYFRVISLPLLIVGLALRL